MLINAIERRISRRSYISEPLSGKDAEKLQAAIDEYAQPGFRMELIAGDGQAFEGLRRSYGMFSGVRNYIVLIADSADPYSEEKLGYYGELLALRATELSLGTCWVGGTFDKKSCPAALKPNERIACVITVGYVSEVFSGKEKIIRKITHRRTKSLEELCDADIAPTDWFLAGVRAVQLAPSAVNRQPVTLRCKKGEISASVKDMDVAGIQLDLGIAKAHFALAANGVWAWGSGGSFTREE